MIDNINFHHFLLNKKLKHHRFRAKVRKIKNPDLKSGTD
ncbi:hypothetical protein HMPREF0378_1408 [Eubacterium nodatum ATCC 33099]|nr:hypothetical protein HMPREF0378_1408 [Eubacterium nodatum ATCC 33099]